MTTQEFIEKMNHAGLRVEIGKEVGKITVTTMTTLETVLTVGTEAKYILNTDFEEFRENTTVHMQMLLSREAWKYASTEIDKR